MKKLLCILIAIFLVMSSGISFAYAHEDEEKDGYSNQDLYNLYTNMGYSFSQNNGNYDNGFNNYDPNNMKILMQMFKQYRKDMDKRNKLLKNIRALKDKLSKMENQANILGQSAASNPLLCFVNGQELSTDVPPVIKYGRTLVPVRALTTALGANVQWDPYTKTAYITKDGNTIALKLNSNIVVVNGQEVKLDVPAESVNNRIIVPIRFIAEMFHQKVQWDANTGSIIIENDDSSNNNGSNNNGGDNTTPNPAAVTFNDSATGTGNNQFEFVGNWLYGYRTGAYNNDNHWSVVKDAYYQVRFSGTQIKVYGAIDPSYGIAAFSIDGGAEANVDCYAQTRSDNILVYTSPVLAVGQHTLKVRVTGTKNSSSSGTFINADRADVFNSTQNSTGNLAFGKTVVTSSNYDATLTADKAVDGNANTRWSSQFSDPQWIYVDLGSQQSISKVKLNWETAYGKSYKIQVSNDAVNWTDVYSTTAGDGGIDQISFTPVSARFVRMYGTERGTLYGYSLLEFEVYNN